MINIELLNKEIKDLGIFKKKLAEKMGVCRYTLDRKLANPDTIRAHDVINICEALRIPIGSQKFIDIFFAPDPNEEANHE